MARSTAWSLSHLWRDDEEMAKKDDDHNSRRPPAQWTAAVRAPRPSWLLRLATYVLLACAIVFLVCHAAGLGYRHDRYNDISPDSDLPQAHLRPPPEAAGQRKVQDGPIQHMNLLTSIRNLITTGGGISRNRNVLFAAASLQSAATVLPMACSMARELHSNVHFAFMGRSDISMEDLVQINGIDPSCPLLLHDARPDYASTSTDERMTLAVERAMIIIHRLIPPQVVLIDSTTTEEPFFHHGTRKYVKKLQTTLIELPERAGTRLSWITKLDSSALAAWNQVRFDIIVHSPRTGTGNLKRLLQSLARADLGGHQVPHLVVELPSVIEQPLEKFMAGFKWPPRESDAEQTPSMLSLRHRISRSRLTEEESSVRLLESFWPADPSLSHVLYLSPHVEISPYFFHYVKYCLLYRRHSRRAASEMLSSNVLAMSFAVPTTTPDGKKPFRPPRSQPEATAFLWQAPTSDAVLFLGDKWVELHGYTSRVLEARKSMARLPEILAEKRVGRQVPAWVEFAMQLSRLRGYTTLYPSQETANVIAVAHNDLPDEPEEFGPSTSAQNRGQQTEDGRLADSMVDMLNALPDEGLQLQLDEMPLLSWDGRLLSGELTLGRDAMELATEFRRQVGQCTEDELEEQIAADKHARDLFCR